MIEIEQQQHNKPCWMLAGGLHKTQDMLLGNIKIKQSLRRILSLT